MLTLLLSGGGLLWGEGPAAETPVEQEKGHLASVRVGMPFKPWNRIYVKVSATRGVTFLLVAKLRNDAHDHDWVAVDAARRVVVINLRKKDIYTPRQQRGVRYDTSIAFTREEKDSIQEAGFSIVRRAAGGANVSDVSVVVPQPAPRAERRGTGRNRGIKSVINMGISVLGAA